jgi:hypothetical protein
MWFKPASLKDLCTILNAHSSDSVKMVVGNTGKGNSYYAIIYCDLQLSLETGSFTAQFDRWNAQVTKNKFKCCQAEMRMLSWEI